MAGRVSRHADGLSVGVLIAATLIGLAAWDWLPARMAIHFDAGATPDGFASKPVALLAVPAVGLLTVGLLRAIPRVGSSAPRDPFAVSGLLVASLLAYTHLLVVAWNLGARFDVTLATLGPVVVGSAALLVWGYRYDRRVR